MGYSIDQLARETGLKRSFLARAFKDALHIADGDRVAAMDLLIQRLEMCMELVSMGVDFKQAWKGTEFASGVRLNRILANAARNAGSLASRAREIGKRLRK